MKKSVLKTIIAASVLQFGFTGIADAHHSFAAEFDAEKPIELSGMVTKVEWTNPHIWIYFNVKNEETGKTENWGAEMGPPHLLQRRGWRRNTLSIGTMIDVDGYLARNGTLRVNARSVTMAGTDDTPGQVLDAGSSQLDRNNDEANGN